MSNTTPTTDLVGSIIAWEQGDLDADGTLELFSTLIRNGDAWKLQGSYGRAAQALIDNGWISETGTVLRTPDGGE